MPNTLHATLGSLANDFASAVLNAIRSASLQEVLAENSSAATRGGPGRPRASSTKVAPAPAREAARSPRANKGGRLARRSPDEIAKTLALVVALVRTKKDGLRSEEIRQTLGLDKREVPRVLREGLKTKKLKSKGQKRATAYSAR